MSIFRKINAIRVSGAKVDVCDLYLFSKELTSARQSIRQALRGMHALKLDIRKNRNLYAAEILNSRYGCMVDELSSKWSHYRMMQWWLNDVSKQIIYEESS